MPLPRFLRRLAAPVRRRTRDRDMQQEMAFHLESITRDYERDLMTPGRVSRTGATRDAARSRQRLARRVRGFAMRVSNSLLAGLLVVIQIGRASCREGV